MHEFKRAHLLPQETATSSEPSPRSSDTHARGGPWLRSHVRSVAQAGHETRAGTLTGATAQQWAAQWRNGLCRPGDPGSLLHWPLTTGAQRRADPLPSQYTTSSSPNLQPCTSTFNKWIVVQVIEWAVVLFVLVSLRRRGGARGLRRREPRGVAARCLRGVAAR